MSLCAYRLIRRLAPRRTVLLLTLGLLTLPVGTLTARAAEAAGRDGPAGAPAMAGAVAEEPTAGPEPAQRGDPGDAGSLSWPVQPRPVVARGWEPPDGPYGAGHRGVDLAAPVGSVVRAPADGRVAHASPVAGRGVLVLTVDGAPYRITHEPVRATVTVGDRVRAGDPVGVLEDGPFHCAEPCLHLGVRTGDGYLDPLSLLRAGPSRLLPVPPVAPPSPELAAGDGAGGVSTALLLLGAAGTWWTVRSRRVPGRATRAAGGPPDCARTASAPRWKRG